MIDAQERFLKQFDESLRPHLLDYAARIEALDVDVVMFMARKAVCLFDSMSRLGLVRGERIWTSNRVLDLNTDWLSGRRIALVDDTLFSGTSLWRTKRALHDKGLTDYSVHVFCASKKSWSPSIVTPVRPFLELDDAAMTGFCTAEVNAISLLPRPYTIDYPLLENVRLPAADVDQAIAIPGWRRIDNSSAQQIAHDVRSVTLEPETAALEEFELRLGWPIGRNSQLVKIRLYSWGVSGNRPAHFGRLLPIVVLDPLTHGELDELWHAVTELFRETGSQPRREALPTRESRLRVVQYLLGFELGAVWLQHLEDCTGTRVQRTVDARQLAYAFSPEVAQALATLTLELPTRWLAPAKPPMPRPVAPIRLEPVESRYRGYDALGIQARLTEPFLEELWPKEMQARELAKLLGPEVFSDPGYREIMNRLNDGYSLPMLRVRIQGLPGGLDPAAVVSRFIDVAIDRGVIVPITVDKDGEIYRAYRHGEDLLFTLSEKRLFCVMLRALLDEAGIAAVPRIWAEKAIAIFIKVAFEAGYLHEWTIGAGERIGLRWTLHGIVAQVDPKQSSTRWITPSR